MNNIIPHLGLNLTLDEVDELDPRALSGRLCVALGLNRGCERAEVIHSCAQTSSEWAVIFLSSSYPYPSTASVSLPSLLEASQRVQAEKQVQLLGVSKVVNVLKNAGEISFESLSAGV